MCSEDRAIEALASLADELADDPRVHAVLCGAIEKLRGRPCKPHWWRLPAVGDDALVCDECGRRLAFATMSGDVQASIVNGFERRHGEEAGADFRSAFNKATARSSLLSQPDTWKGPSFDEQKARSRALRFGTPIPALKSELIPQDPQPVVIKSESTE